LLAESVAEGFGGRVRFVSENYGDSRLAERFGVRRYPAIFVDDILAATPKDFGFFGKGEGPDAGRYAPIRSAASHERLRADLTRMIELVLAGERGAARAGAPAESGGEIARMPAFSLTDLDGRALSRESFADRVLLVEFWATWCPPCRGTLTWLGDLKRRHGDRIAVLALAVESDEGAVRELARRLDLPLHWGMATPEIAGGFGDVSAVPTLLLFDRKGSAAAAFYGAPPDLHAAAEGRIRALLD
jgi:thiol-disulfide isomerase/thioredoxin